MSLGEEEIRDDPSATFVIGLVEMKKGCCETTVIWKNEELYLHSWKEWDSWVRNEENCVHSEKERDEDLEITSRNEWLSIRSCCHSLYVQLNFLPRNFANKDKEGERRSELRTRSSSDGKIEGVGIIGKKESRPPTSFRSNMSGHRFSKLVA